MVLSMSMQNTAPAPMPGMEGWQAAGYLATMLISWGVDSMVPRINCVTMNAVVTSRSVALKNP